MRRTRSGLLMTGLIAMSALAACGGKAPASAGTAAADAGTPAATPAVQVSDQDRAQAKQIFATRCTVCHGVDGRGDGPGGGALNPKPRNYHDPAWQSSVTDSEIENAILYGGSAVGRSPAMIANPDLASKPEVVAALREMVRRFGREK